MEKRSLRPYINIIAALLVTAGLLAFTVDVSVSNESGVVTDFPMTVGEWHGDEIRFCQNSECQKEFMLSELDDPDVCPECGGVLDGGSLVENSILPEDTILKKVRYTHPDGRSVFVAMVMSGKERSSIHRPQLCLTGQGRQIMKEEIFDVELDGRDPLRVMMLDLVQTVSGKDKKSVQIPQYYAYWFVGKDRETPSHLARMFWMAYDRIVRNVAHRWSYISVSGPRGTLDPEDKSHMELVQGFLHDFYPEIINHNI